MCNKMIRKALTYTTKTCVTRQRSRTVHALFWFLNVFLQPRDHNLLHAILLVHKVERENLRNELGAVAMFCKLKLTEMEFL